MSDQENQLPEQMEDIQQLQDSNNQDLSSDSLQEDILNDLMKPPAQEEVQRPVQLLDGISDFAAIKTQNYVIDTNQALNGDEGEEVRLLVLNFQKIRASCQSFRNVYKLLGKEEMLKDNTKLLDINQIPQIGKDLEERNKQNTLTLLKEQGKEYKNFNDEIIRMIDYQNQEDDNQDAFYFRRQLKKIENNIYYDKKYNIDYQINQIYGDQAYQIMARKYDGLREKARRRDQKLLDKYQKAQLLKKYI